jgi:hypothetical protein
MRCRALTAVRRSRPGFNPLAIFGDFGKYPESLHANIGADYYIAFCSPK